MITAEQLGGETHALLGLLNDLNYSDPETQRLIRMLINELAWVNDGEAMQASVAIVTGASI